MEDLDGRGCCPQLSRPWGEQSQLSAPYLPGLVAMQKRSVISGQMSTQGRLVTKSGHFMSEAYRIFNRVASEGK